MYQRYLNIDNYSKYGNPYVVRVVIKKKHFIVWSGKDIELGTKIAQRVEELMNISRSKFLEWYDYDREAEIEVMKNGKSNKNAGM